MTDTLRRLLSEATPGPWKGNNTVIWRDGDPVLDAAIAANDPKAGPIIASEFNQTGLAGPSRFVGSTFGVRPVRGANAALIVAAVNALPALLDVAEAARKALTEYDATHLVHDVAYENVADALDALREPLRRLEATR